MKKTSKTEYIIEAEIQEKPNASPYNIHHYIYPNPKNDSEAFQVFGKILSKKKKRYYRVTARLTKKETIVTENMLT